LFGAPDEAKFSMDESRTGNIPQVSDEENALLTAPYTYTRSKIDDFSNGTQQSPRTVWLPSGVLPELPGCH
jgi:hypothetical protein